MYLKDELTNDEVIAIVKDEISKISTVELVKAAATLDTKLIEDVVRNSVRRVCIEGGKKEVFSWIPIIIAIAGTLLLSYFIFKK